MKIYLAGPLFTTGERLFNYILARNLRDLGHDVWLPQEKEPRDVQPDDVYWPQAVFDLDVQGLDWADVIVANMDGPDADSGTSWEVGYSYAKLKPIVLFRTDFRKAGEADAPYNIMLGKSANAWVLLDATKCDAVDVALGIYNKLNAIQQQRTAGESSAKS